MQTFDFIVIGGGPAGCAVAARLSEARDCQVALLEAGPDRRGLLGDNVALGTLALGPRRSGNNYGLKTEPEAGLNHQRAYCPLGRGLGGGSSINTLRYLRGNRLDYDGWAARGNPGWGWDDVLPWFRKSENNQTFRDDPLHGTGGPLWVEELRSANPFQELCLRACEEMGIPRNPDLNGVSQEGVRVTQVCMKRGQRWGTAKAYVHPLLGVRGNFHLLCDTQCTRIVFEGRRAVGVQVLQGGRLRELRARKEVIVCGGGILSAKLLQLSGVGDPDWLGPLGIPVVHALPAVGRHLQDHVDVILGFHIPGDANLLALSPITARRLRSAWPEWKRRGTGPCATNFAEVTGFMSLTPASPMPEIQYEFVVALAMNHGRDVFTRHGLSVHVLLLHPKSRGTVRLASRDARAAPQVRFNYFEHEDDMRTLVEGIKRTHAIVMRSRALGGLVRRDLRSAHCTSDADWEQLARRVAGTNYHPVGSCRMGPDARDAVVDARLRVHGLQGLRVVDSSIMPAIVGGNTMAPSIMIGEKGADMIKQDWGLAEHAGARAPDAARARATPAG